MPLLILQLALLVAAAFVIGGVLGWLLRRKRAPMPEKDQVIIAAAHAVPLVDEKPEPVQPAATQAAVAQDAPVAKAVPDAEVVGGPLPVAQSGSEAPVEDRADDADRPQLLDAPRGGKSDDLTAIAGIGKAVQAMLNDLGIFHYDQIAGWTQEESAWIERAIGFPRRVERENWIAQATKLGQAAGKSASASRTRKSTAKPKAKTVKKTEA